MWKGMQKAEGRRRKAQMRHAEWGKHGWQGWARMAGQTCRMESGARRTIQISHCEKFDISLGRRRLRKWREQFRHFCHFCQVGPWLWARSEMSFGGQSVSRLNRSAFCVVTLFSLTAEVRRAVAGAIFQGGVAPIRSELRGDGVGFDFVVEGLAANAEALGGFQLVAVGFLEDFDDLVAFHRFHQGEVFVLLRRGGGVADREVLERSEE